MIEALRILIVEDDGLIAMDLADLLIGMGHQVCGIASTAASAEAAAQNHHPDLMIVDANLGSSSGVEAMGHILATGYIAHFYVTGSPCEVRPVARGAIVIAKPYTLRDLEGGIAGARAAGRLRPGVI